MDDFLKESKDQRRSQRFRINLQARYVSDALMVDGQVTDISPDGLFFASEYLDGRGEKVWVWLDIPWLESPLQLCGEVAWVSEAYGAGGMGIRFCEVSLGSRKVLASLAYSAPSEAVGYAANP